MSVLVLRKAEISDMEDVYSWVNDPATRELSFTTKQIAPEEHQSWYLSSLDNKDRTILIGEVDGQKVGQVRLDKLNVSVYEFDVNVSPLSRGKGYGTMLIDKACAYEGFRNGTLFIARIKEVNEASLKAFKKAGFFNITKINDKDHGPVEVLGRIKGA